MASVVKVNLQSTRKHGWRYGALALLWLFFAQVAFTARETSITLDEPLHIASGYACLVTGDYRLVEEHPPLLKMLQAAPLLLADPALPDPRTRPGWNDGDLIMVAQHLIVPYRPIDPLVYAARVPTMLVGIILGALIFRWGADVFGQLGGLLALALYSFDPNILAHASVAGTDLGAACAIFGAMYLFWRWIREPRGPRWKRALVAAVGLGLALGVKTTVLMLGPIFAGFILLGRPRQHPLAAYLRQGLGIVAIAFLTLWAIYRFEIGPVAGLPFPIPAASHLKPLFKLQIHMREGHSAFLMGKNYHHGDWRYFPIAFALKTPLLTLTLLLITAGRLINAALHAPGKIKQRARQIAAVGALPAFYFAVSLTSGINIGYRHLLPILPFIYVGVASCSAQIITAHTAFITRRAIHVTSFILFLSYAATTLTLFPWYLSYFNVLAGGPDGGYHYLADSNVDWGHTWKALQRYLEAENITVFNLSQYTINDPHAYGLDYTPIPPWPDAPPVLPQRFAPAPGIYAISANQLQGLTVALPEMYDYFRHLRPKARIGHAMHIYEIAPYPNMSWIAQCSTPVVPLPAEIWQEGLGRANLQAYTFDCAQSWLIPPGNGWYALPYHTEQLWHPLQRARRAYEQPYPGYTPAFTLYEWMEQARGEGATPIAVYAAPSSWPPPQARTEGVAAVVPLNVGPHLKLLDIHVAQPRIPAGATLNVETYWQVRTQPTQTLSLMAHLLNSDGVPIAIGDGLGVSIDQWKPDSVIIQRHTLLIPAGSAPENYWFQTGAYTLDDLNRYPILTSEGFIMGDRVLLAEAIEVTP